jgi:hypothetical protein
VSAGKHSLQQTARAEFVLATASNVQDSKEANTNLC